MTRSAGLSFHVVDITEGCPAAGMRIDLSRLGSDGTRSPVWQNRCLNLAGKLTTASEVIGRGRYEAVFHVGNYYRERGQVLPELPFLDVVPFRFGINEPAHHHLPLKLTPWGFSLFLTR